MRIHGAPVSKAFVTEHLAKRLARMGQFPVVVRGESGSTFRTLQPVIDLCEEVGIDAVALRLTDLPMDQLSKHADPEPKVPLYWHYRAKP